MKINRRFFRNTTAPLHNYLANDTSGITVSRSVHHLSECCRLAGFLMSFFREHFLFDSEREFIAFGNCAVSLEIQFKLEFRNIFLLEMMKLIVRVSKLNCCIPRVSLMSKIKPLYQTTQTWKNISYCPKNKKSNILRTLRRVK